MSKLNGQTVSVVEVETDEVAFPIEPLHEKIVIKPFPAEEVSEGGIIIPDSVKERPNKATVVAVGGGLKDRPMALQVGDVVFHVKEAGIEVEHKKEQYFIVRDTDVLAKLK